jgi:murein L,D-transpeptidase YafK
MNRLIQLEQLIELIKTKWDDSMVNRKTPAFRNGLKVGDVVRYTRRDTPSFWVFRRDDESMSPSFHKLTDKDDYTDIDLNYIVKVDKDEISKPRAVSEFLSELEEQAKKKADIERQIAELQKALTNVQTDIAMLDYGLADQHKVKRIA